MMRRRSQIEYEEQFRGGWCPNGQYSRSDVFSHQQEFYDDEDRYYREQLRILWSHRLDPDFSYYQQQARKNLYRPNSYYDEDQFARQPAMMYQRPPSALSSDNQTYNTTINPYPYPYTTTPSTYPSQINPYPYTTPPSTYHSQVNPYSNQQATPHRDQLPFRRTEEDGGVSRQRARVEGVEWICGQDGMKQGCLQAPDLRKLTTTKLENKAKMEADLVQLQNRDLQQPITIELEPKVDKIGDLIQVLIGPVEAGLKEGAEEIEIQEEQTQEDLVKAQREEAQNKMLGKNGWVADTGRQSPFGALTGSSYHGSAISIPSKPSLPTPGSSTIGHQPRSTAATEDIDLRLTAVDVTDRSFGEPPISQFNSTISVLVSPSQQEPGSSTIPHQPESTVTEDTDRGSGLPHPSRFPPTGIGDSPSKTLTRVEANVEEVEKEKFEYQAEVSRLLDLIVHSLYSHKEVFLRELVSNASDALDKLRFLSVTEPSLLGETSDIELRIKPDPDNGTITVIDTGIGMTKEELIDCLGTMAQRGTSKYLKALKENKDHGADNGLIGQFGVGFYSAFLVSQKVVVSTKSPRSDKQYVWEAEADSSSYVIKEETDPEKLLRRGTQVTLYLRDDDKYEFSDPTRIQNLVKNYSQFVAFPIYTWLEKSKTIEVEEDVEPKEGEEQPEGEKKKKKTTKTEKYWDWELANETKPIWMRNSKEVEKDEYHEFYKKTFNEFLDPLAYTHFTTEGEVEFRSVLYVPGMGPINNEDVMNPKTKNIRLYVKRVFISDDFDGELFPRYLSFVKGVVDSDDLPLNVSREILQESRIVRIMRKRLVRKTFDMIQDISGNENKEDYKKFWENFGRFLKLGCVEDAGNHKRIAPLLRFYTSKSEEELTSLDDYVENMGEKQKAIYYFATDSLKSAKSAPFLEKLVQKDIEVLYLIEPIDEVAIQNLQTYKEKKFVDISKEDLELGDEDEVKERETKQEYNLLCDWIKQQLGDKVAKVQVSKRLSSSPCVLVSGKFGWSANMERLMKAQALGDTSSLEFMRGRRILEINPDHPIVKDLNAACKNAPDSDDAKRVVDLLYDTALISSGFSPDSPADLGNKIYEMMAMAVGGRWGRSDEDDADAPEENPAESETGDAEPSDAGVIEPSEVRAESDPWQD